MMECNNCGATMTYERGCPPTRYEPGEPSGWYCNECGHFQDGDPADFAEYDTVMEAQDD